MPVGQPGMSGRTKGLMVVSVIVIIVAAVVFFGPRYGLDISRFFAAEPGTPAPNMVKLYPVFDPVTSKVRFVLETGTYEITGFQFRAGISAATFTNIGGFTGSAIFNQILEPANLLSDGSLSFAAGVPSGGTGATSTTTIATIDYTTLSADTAATQICVTVDMTNTIVSARNVDANVLDMGLNGWSNKACIPIIAPTATPAPSIITFTADPVSITSGQTSVLSWTVTGATSITINGASTDTRTSISVSPTITTSYTLVATGPGGTAMASITVTVVQPTTTVLPPIRGDVNGDGRVDISDFNIVVANFGKVPSGTVLGDENKDGKIDILDFNAVVTYFGTITTK